MTQAWVLIFMLNSNYYEIIHSGEYQPLSVQAPTPISILIPYPTEKQCSEALAAVMKHFALGGNQATCKKTSIQTDKVQPK